MAKDASPKGSIIYKILIVVLAAAVIASILYPDSLWKKEEQLTKLCRQNMEHILYAEYVYLAETDSFNNKITEVVDFIKSDTTGRMLRSYTKSDSILSVSIVDYMKNLDDLSKSIVDTLAEFGRKWDIDTTETMILDSLRSYPEFALKIDSIALFSLDNMFLCPTVADSYRITVVDTSVIKVVNIYCPIDSLDSLKVASDFKLSKLGGLTITNHGSIESVEKTWK